MFLKYEAHGFNQLINVMEMKVYVPISVIMPRPLYAYVYSGIQDELFHFITCRYFDFLFANNPIIR